MGSTFREMGWQDRTVLVRRSELLEELKKNRSKHLTDHEQACLGYRRKVATLLADISREARDKRETLMDLDARGEMPEHAVHISIQLPPLPTHHQKAYDQIIRMMEMCVEDDVELTASQFGCFVQDDWDWKETWTASNRAYR